MLAWAIGRNAKKQQSEHNEQASEISALREQVTQMRTAQQELCTRIDNLERAMQRRQRKASHAPPPATPEPIK